MLERQLPEGAIDPELEESYLDDLDSELESLDLVSSPTKAKAKPAGFWGQIAQGWNNLSFRSKIFMLLLLSSTIPVIVVTQLLVGVIKGNELRNLQENLRKDGKAFKDDYVVWTQVDSEAKSQNLANLVRASKIDLNNPNQVAANRADLQDLIKIENGSEPELNKNFQILTDAQGRTVAQDIVILDGDFTKYPLLPKKDAPLTPSKYLPVSVAPGIPLGDMPIVKNSLQTGKPLSGIELLNSTLLQRLKLEKQADIGIRTQPTANLPEAKRPVPEGTYNIENGKVGLVTVAVYPIKINNRLVGTAIVGTVLNRHYDLVDKFTQSYQVDTATIFARDWRVSTNVPYGDKQTRAIGTRVAREVADKVLDRGQDFSGQTNIVGTDYITFYTPLYDHQLQLNPKQAKPIGIAYLGESLTQSRAINQVSNNINRELLTAYAIGGGTLLVMGLLIFPLASSISRPIKRLSTFAQNLRSGQLGERLETASRRDEIGVLSQELNQTAASLEESMAEQQQEARLAQLLRDVTLELGKYPQVDNVFSTVVEKLRQAIDSDRVMVYRFDETTWIGTVTAESVAPEWPAALGAEIDDHCFRQDYLEKYRQGRIWSADDVYAANLQECHLKILEPFGVKANLVVPIIRGSRRVLAGLLIAHQCSGPRAWQPFDMDLLVQVATQIGLALDRANLLNQQKASKELLQQRAIELLSEVDAIGKGDLTVRATVSEDAIGTIADSYNATVTSLRKIVSQVQTAAQKLTATTSNNEVSVRELSKETSEQAEEINDALDRLQQMTDSIQAVATSAEKAEVAVKQASQVVAESDTAMNRTVDGILAIRETVAQTSKKVKRLGESSQKISKVVNLIGTFAEQTNLLALNAAIEAANAGEQGRGFAVVAERVRALARQSAQATAEIEGLVTEIQTETNEVVAAMEAGTEQVVTGTQLVDETKQSLTKITAASAEIRALVDAIAQAAVAQSQNSEAVTQAMSKVAAMSDKTLEEATQVSSSFKELLAVAEELQASASQFKVS